MISKGAYLMKFRFSVAITVLIGLGVSVFAMPLESARWFEKKSKPQWPCVYDANDRGWSPLDLKLRIEKDFAAAKDAPAVIAAVFTNACTEIQGLTVSGCETVQIFCNGQEITPSMQTKTEWVFALPLAAGANTLSLQFQTAGKKSQLFLTPVDMDYVLPTAQKQLEALKRSVDYLAKANSAYPADRIRKQIAEL